MFQTIRIFPHAGLCCTIVYKCLPVSGVRMNRDGCIANIPRTGHSQEGQEIFSSPAEQMPPIQAPDLYP